MCPVSSAVSSVPLGLWRFSANKPAPLKASLDYDLNLYSHPLEIVYKNADTEQSKVV